MRKDSSNKEDDETQDASLAVASQDRLEMGTGSIGSSPRGFWWFDAKGLDPGAFPQTASFFGGRGPFMLDRTQEERVDVTWSRVVELNVSDFFAFFFQDH